MEIKSKRAASLSNFEVLGLLNEIKEDAHGSTQANSHLATILYETSHYLQDSVSSKQNATDIHNLLVALRDFPVKLLWQEKLMIINNPPTSSLQLSLIVRDADERLTEEQIEELLSVIDKILIHSDSDT